MPVADIPALLRENLPEGIVRLGDAIGEEFWDFMESEDVEALGDAIEQAERGIPAVPQAAPLKLGMTWAGAGAAKLPQYIKFLRQMRKKARKPTLPTLMGKPTKAQSAVQAYTEARRPASVARAEAVMHERNPYSRGGNIAGEFVPLKKPEVGKPQGVYGVYQDIPGGRSAQEMIGTFGHEIGHGQSAARATRRGEKFSDWYQRKLKEVGYEAHPEELRANRLKETAERDIEAFLEQGHAVRDQLPVADRQIFDSIEEIFTQSARQKVNQAVGIWDTVPSERINEAWEAVIGKKPSKVRQSVNKLLGRGAAAQKVSKDPLGAGLFVDIKGGITKMKSGELHPEVVARLRKQKKESRGFEVRPADVRVPDKALLGHKEALRKAVEKAWEGGYAMAGPKGSEVLIEFKDGPKWRYTRIKPADWELFFEDPLMWIENDEFRRMMRGE